MVQLDGKDKLTDISEDLYYLAKQLYDNLMN